MTARDRHVLPFWAGGKLVRTKSIPNVNEMRLRDSLASLHWMLHTPEGVRAQDLGHGKIQVQYGQKCLAVRSELNRRGVMVGIDCRWCGDQPKEQS